MVSPPLLMLLPGSYGIDGSSGAPILYWLHPGALPRGCPSHWLMVLAGDDWLGTPRAPAPPWDSDLVGLIRDSKAS